MADKNGFSTDDAGSGIKPVTNEELEETELASERAVGKFNKNELGSSGTRIFGEIFDEEYLGQLSGMRRADIFDEIVRSDDIVTMLLTGRKNPILKATWSIEPAKGDTPEEDERNQEIADRCHHEFFERMDKDFTELLEEILSFVEHGYSLFERVHERVDDPKFGQYLGYHKIAWRSQRTIDQWKLHNEGKDKGKIDTVFQQADGDLDAHVHIPGKWVTVFSLRKKGDNYEGISALRPIYGNIQRKEVFLKLLAIGIERYAINTPVGRVPKGLEKSTERDTFVKMLKKISSHQQNYFVLPEGWEVEFLKNPFDAEKIVAAINREDEGMVKSFMANHLNLGQGGSSGSYALGTDLSDQFLSIIEHDAQIVKSRFNKEIITEFVDMNFGKQNVYPKLKVTGINDKFSQEFAEILKLLAEKRLLTPTENLEVWLRKKLDVPELLEEDKLLIPGVREPEPDPKPGLFAEVETGIQFADLRKTKAKVNEQLTKSGEVVMKGMQENLQLRGRALINNLINRMARVSRGQWKKIIRTQGPMPAVNDYQKKLKRALSETAGRSISQARNEVPGGRKVKFAEGIKARMSFAEVIKTFDQLPKNTQEVILTSSNLVVDKQFTDIRSSILLTANGAVDETSDVEVVRKRMEEQLDKSTTGSGKTGIAGSIVLAGNNLTAQVYNTARIEFFQSPDVLEKIEAFQFQNTSPVSPICQDLNGRIFAKNDPESAQFLPPLHHNCKSFIVPVFDLQGKEISEIGLKPSKANLEKFKTL